MIYKIAIFFFIHQFNVIKGTNSEANESFLNYTLTHTHIQNVKIAYKHRVRAQKYAVFAANSDSMIDVERKNVP